MSTARLRDLYLKQEPRLAQLRYPTSLSWMSACLSCPSRRDAWWPHPANLQARHLSKQSGRDVKAGGVTGHTLTKWRCCTTFCLADFTDKLRSSFPGCQPDLRKLSRRVRTASLTVTVYPPADVLLSRFSVLLSISNPTTCPPQSTARVIMEAHIPYG